MIILFTGTHDIKNATISDVHKRINIVTDYFEHSSAAGAFFIFVFLTGKTVDLTRTVYLALDRNTSRNHTLPFSLSPGRYDVCVYDIESDGTLASGVGYPAVVRELVISNATGGNVIFIWKNSQ